MEVLQRLARGGVDAGQVSPPRPIGSAANARCRERILSELRSLGLRPEVQEVFGASTRQDCAGVVRNVVCRLRGQGQFSSSASLPGSGIGSSERQAILCMAHYDSVGAGPGVADDLAGVAALLEVARVLLKDRPLERDVILLFEDGEEHGLLGAELFAAKHPWSKEVGAVINLEGRGTTGPSRLFEMGAGNEWIVRAFKSQSSRPSSTSVSAEIYKRMPNDTDYTVWRERGIPGLNFACIGGVNRYHTPLDDLANLSVDTLQHHGTNALEAIRALDGVAAWPASTDAKRDAVFFDVFGRQLVLYKVRTARILGVLLVIAALFAAARSIRSGMARPLWILGAAVLAFAVLGLAFVLARSEGGYFQLLGVEARVGHPTHMGPVLVGYFAAAFAGVGLGAYLIGALCRASEVGLAVTLLFSLLSAATAWAAPGVSFLFAIPALVLCLGGVIVRQRGDVGARWARLGIFALLVSAALMLTPIHSGLISAFGVADPGMAVAPLLMGALMLLPALMGEGRSSGLWLAGIGTIAALLAGVFVSQLDVHTPALPGHVNLVHLQGEKGARWQILGGEDPVDRDLVKELQTALGGGLDAEGKKLPLRSVPWSWRPLAAAPAPESAEELPSLEVLSQIPIENGGTLFDVRALPGRPSDQLLVQLVGDAVMVVDGISMPSRSVRLLGPSDEGIEFQVRDGGTAASLLMAELSERGKPGLIVKLTSKQFGLRGVRGRAADEYLGVRPAEFVPYADGDGSLMQSVVVLREPERKGGKKGPEEGPEEGDDSKGDDVTDDEKAK